MWTRMWLSREDYKSFELKLFQCSIRQNACGWQGAKKGHWIPCLLALAFVIEGTPLPDLCRLISRATMMWLKLVSEMGQQNHNLKKCQQQCGTTYSPKREVQYSQAVRNGRYKHLWNMSFLAKTNRSAVRRSHQSSTPATPTSETQNALCLVGDYKCAARPGQ